MDQRMRGDSAFRRPALWATVAIAVGAATSPAAAAAAKPDLRVSNPGSPPASVAIGDPFKVTAEIANGGSRKAGRSTARFYASFDEVRDPTDFRLAGAQRVGRLGPSKSSRSQVSLRLPPDTPLDELRLLACADDTKKIAESNEKNNCEASASGLAVMPAKTTLDLIDEALAAGKITLDQAMLYKVRAATGLPQPPARYQAADAFGELDSAHVLEEVAHNWNSLSLATQKELDPYFSPPVYEGARGSSGWPGPEALRRGGEDIFCYGGERRMAAVEDWSFIDTEHFRIWYYTANDLAPAGSFAEGFNSTPAASALLAERLAAIAEHVYDEETTLLGRSPLTDGAEPCNGEGDRIDIYAANLSTEAQAQVHPYPPGYIHRPGWMHIGPGYADTPTKVRDVFAHEFAHLVQLAYDYAPSENRVHMYGWLEEATANWMVDYVYPNDNFEHPFASAYLLEYGFNNPLPLKRGYLTGQLNADTNGYEDYLFLFYVTRQTGNPLIIRSIWNNTEHLDSVDAVDQAIPGGLLARWPEFAVFNVNRGNEDYYEDWDGLTSALSLAGDTQPVIPIELEGTRSRTFPMPQYRDLYWMASEYTTFEFSDPDVKQVVFRDYDFNQPVDPEDAFMQHIRAWIELESGETRIEDWDLAEEVTFCRDRADEDISRVVLFHINSSPVDYLGNDDNDDSSIAQFPTKDAAVVASKRCEFPRQWSGRASGTLSYEGVTESWSSTYTMNRSFGDQFSAYYGALDSEGTIVWQISGTDHDSGCTYSGGATIDGAGNLSIYSDESLSSYGTQVARSKIFEFVNITQDCPTGDPETIPYIPLNCGDCAVSDSVPYEPGATQLSSERVYTTELDQAVSWQWNLVTGPTPPPPAGRTKR